MSQFGDITEYGLLLTDDAAIRFANDYLQGWKCVYNFGSNGIEYKDSNGKIKHLPLKDIRAIIEAKKFGNVIAKSLGEK